MNWIGKRFNFVQCDARLNRLLKNSICGARPLKGHFNLEDL